MTKLKKIFPHTFITLILILTSLSWANTPRANDTAITQKLNALGITQVTIQNSPIKGIKSVLTEHGVLYVSQDGRYIFEGNLLELTPEGIKNISNQLLLPKLDALKNTLIHFPAKNARYTISVFMDISCPYCHKFHEQIAQYNALGISVNYIAFPRAGLNSQTAKQMESIWQSNNAQQAFNDAEQGRLPKELKTPHIVRQHYQLGLLFKVSGTPTIILSNGEVLPGYIPPKQLLKILQETPL